MFQVDEYAVKQRMNELQEEFKQYRLARQFKSTKKKTAKSASRVLMMSFRWWR
jgi:cell shape-determining protein MreC